MKGSRVHGDRLSELPVSLIHHIFSFLPMRGVVSTTLLSKRWENLWTTVPCLNFFEDKDYYEYGDEDEDEDEYDSLQRKAEKFQHFVNRALMLWKGVKILKFKIDVELPHNLSLASYVNVWVRFAVNHEVEELDIIIWGELWDPPEQWFPPSLNSCSSLRKLSLVGFSVQSLGSPPWNQLKSLKINVAFDSQFSGDVVNRILLCSPELEVFELQLYQNENLNISSRSLKKLKIKTHLEISEDRPSLPTLRIYCPNLEKLEILGLFGKCLFTDISSLVDANIHFFYDFHVSAYLVELLEETMKQVFSTIQHAEKVTLSYLCIQALGALHKRYLRSPLPNVKFLKLDINDIEFGDMIYVLGNFPNVKRLVIDQRADMKLEEFDAVNYMEFESNLFKSFLLELKTAEISSNFYDVSIFGFIEFLLKQAVKLEKVVLQSYSGFPPRHKETLFQISEKLLNMPRSSQTAKVIFKISETDHYNRRILLTIVREK